MDFNSVAVRYSFSDANIQPNTCARFERCNFYGDDRLEIELILPLHGYSALVSKIYTRKINDVNTY